MTDNTVQSNSIPSLPPNQPYFDIKGPQKKEVDWGKYVIVMDMGTKDTGIRVFEGTLIPNVSKKPQLIADKSIKIESKNESFLSKISAFFSRSTKKPEGDLPKEHLLDTKDLHLIDIRGKLGDISKLDDNKKVKTPEVYVKEIMDKITLEAITIAGLDPSQMSDTEKEEILKKVNVRITASSWARTLDPERNIHDAQIIKLLMKQQEKYKQLKFDILTQRVESITSILSGQQVFGHAKIRGVTVENSVFGEAGGGSLQFKYAPKQTEEFGGNKTTQLLKESDDVFKVKDITKDKILKDMGDNKIAEVDENFICQGLLAVALRNDVIGGSINKETQIFTPGLLKLDAKEMVKWNKGEFRVPIYQIIEALTTYLKSNNTNPSDREKTAPQVVLLALLEALRDRDGDNLFILNASGDTTLHYEQPGKNEYITALKPSSSAGTAVRFFQGDIFERLFNAESNIKHKIEGERPRPQQPGILSRLWSRITGS